ncbi:GNAT family N-acetyltransferase [Deinococcus koreensis]|uniref:GNAT family N-acetyltransferase n=1 Tax=Deinococcus koreensis TaxID=2054903 RepID=A0A2K3UYW0_9DEIO|nr:GNAT family N-acetyltransferase [Deinococcus koreensis]PNY81726.1 GNAT family N-acetyltransferase [Deinococcus koreensis]
MIQYRLRAPIDFTALGRLRQAAWGGSSDGGWWRPVLERSLTWVTAHQGDALVGFVNVVWDGGVHAFLLDTTVHPAYQQRSIGRELVRRAARAAREHGGLEWLHVDYEPHLSGFYEGCGFTPTPAGLLKLG